MLNLNLDKNASESPAMQVKYISQKDFNANRFKYQNEFSYCPECNRDYCPGFDGIDQYCENCYLVQNCRKIEEQIGEFRFACLKRLPEYNPTLLIKTCNFCLVKLRIKSLIKQSGNTNNPEQKLAFLNQIKFILHNTRNKEQRQALTELTSGLTPVKLKWKKSNRLIKEEKAKLKLEKRLAKKEKKIRQNEELVNKVSNVIGLDEARLKINLKKEKKRKNRLSRTPRTGCLHYKMPLRIVYC